MDPENINNVNDQNNVKTGWEGVAAMAEKQLQKSEHKGSLLGDNTLNTYNHIVNTYPSESERKISDFIDQHYGQLDTSNTQENIYAIEDSNGDHTASANFNIARAVLSSRFGEDRDVRRILARGYEIESEAEVDKEVGHEVIVVASNGDYGEGATKETANENMANWAREEVFATFSRKDSPLSETDQDVIINMVKERCDTYMAGGHEDWYESPLRSHRKQVGDYLEDDIKTLRRIFDGQGLRVALHKDILKIFKMSDGESIRMDKGWEGYNFSEIIGRTMLDMNDFADAIKYANHKVELVQDLEKRIRQYNIYRKAVQSGREALGL